MADFIGTRNMNQCRSFYQKTIKEYGSTSNFLNFFSNEIKEAGQRNKAYKEQLLTLKEKILGNSETRV